MRDIMNKNLRGVIIVVCSFICFYLGYYLFQGNKLGEYISFYTYSYIFICYKKYY